MKAVVLGATGHIGTYLVPMLVKAGYETVAVTRSKSSPYEWDPAWDRAERVLLDRNTEEGFERLVAMDPDVLVDLVNFDIADTRKVVEAFAERRLSHYLYCSSCWAHGFGEIHPADPDDLLKAPIDHYGRDKFASELYLKYEWRRNGFPATVIMPGQISGPGWTIMNPWANKTARPFQIIADGETLYLPNFGQEILHHVHGYDVAQVFFRAIQHRNAALGETFDAEAAQSVTLYGYARHVYEFFGNEPKIDFLPWKEWCDYVGDEKECSDTYHHIVRSHTFSLEKERRLLGYQPKFTNLETIDLAVQSYVDRGLVRVGQAQW